MPDRAAFIPLNTYPEAAADDAIPGVISFAGALGCKLHVPTFAVDIPSVGSPPGGYLINVEGMSRAAEERSRAECERLHALVEKTGSPGLGVSVTSHEVVMGGAPSSAATEARDFDLSLVPWSPEAVAAQDMAQPSMPEPSRQPCRTRPRMRGHSFWKWVALAIPACAISSSAMRLRGFSAI